jgi:predicted Zn finger-like uncharacterized protein
MLIVCPSCATSYMIDPASVGPAGRSVRCARCRATWFVGPPAEDKSVDAFVDGVIAEAEREGGGGGSLARAPEPPPPPSPPRAEAPPAPPAMQNFAAERQPQPSPTVEPPAEIPHTEPPTLAEAPSLVPPAGHAPLPEPGAALAEDEESFTARRRRLMVKRQRARRSSRWTALVLVLFAFNVALIGARSEVVRYLPQTASLFAAIGLPVNVRELAFENVRISRETVEGASVLAIEGKIVSKANRPLEVPRLRFAARNASRNELYVWTARPERSILGPGESIPFRSTLAKPPSDAVDIMVRFFTAQDTVRDN